MADAAGATATATPTIIIQASNYSPLAANYSGAIHSFPTRRSSDLGVLANDTDVDAGDTKTVVAVNAQSAAVGTQITLASGALLTVQADGKIGKAHDCTPVTHQSRMPASA